MLLLGGPAGSGKTAMLGEIARRAASHGFAVLYGRAEEGLDLAYGPWRQAMGDRWPSAEDRTELFMAVAEALRAPRHPQLIALDDLQWADRDSMLLLTYVTGALQPADVLVVASYRSTEVEGHEGLTGLLSRLSADPSVERIELGGFDRADISTLVDKTVPDGPGREALTRTVWASTDGNPFFVTALLEGLESGAQSPPSTLAAAIHHRVSRLGPDALDVLTAAAVAGGGFSAAVVAAVGELDIARVEHTLLRARRDGLVRDAPAGYEFVHALVAETLLDRVSASWRRAAHVRAASALVAEGTGPAAVARHLAAAGPTDAAGRQAAVDAMSRAGVSDLEALAYDEAVARLSEALRLAEAWNLDEHRVCSILVALGRAQRRAARDDAGFATLVRALELCVRLGRWDDFLLAARDLPLLPAWLPDPRLVGVLEHVLESAPPGADAVRAVALSRLSWAWHYRDFEQSRQLAEEAMVLAERSGHRLAAVSARHSVLIAGLGDTDPRQQLAYFDAVDAPDARWDADEHSDRALLIMLRGHHLLRVGDVHAFGLLASQLVDRDRPSRPDARWQGLVWEATRAIVEGRFEHARQLASEAAASESGAGRQLNTWVLGAQVATEAYFRGDLGMLADMVVGLAEEFPHPAARGIRLATLAAAGRVTEAGAQLQELVAGGLAGLPRDELSPFAAVLLADACITLGAKQEARELSAWLEPYAGQLVVLSPASVACLGAADRARGRLALFLGRVSDARRHFEDAVALEARVGARAALALTRADQACLGVPGAAAEARAVAAELGMNGVLRTLDALSEPERGTMRRSGDAWVLSYRGVEVSVKDVLGLGYLRELLARPGTPVHVLDLQGGSANSAAEVLDDRAKAAYRARLTELEEDLAEAEAFGDPERASRLEAERRSLVDELSRAVGLGGRDRHLGSDAERARVNVTRALRLAIDRVERQHPDLGRHLRVCVRTGTECEYAPAPGEEVAWST